MVLLRLKVEGLLPAILVLQCSAALCANRSDAIFTSTHVGPQMTTGLVVGAQVSSTSMILIAAKMRT